MLNQQVEIFLSRTSEKVHFLATKSDAAVGRLMMLICLISLVGEGKMPFYALRGFMKKLTTKLVATAFVGLFGFSACFAPAPKPRTRPAASAPVPQDAPAQVSSKDLLIQLGVPTVFGGLGSAAGSYVSKRFFKENKIADFILPMASGIVGAFLAHKFVVPRLTK